MPYAAEYYGQEHLPEALAAVATLPGVDLAVVRGALSDADTLDWLADTQLHEDPAGRLYEAIPSLSEADRLVRELWHERGYAGMEVVEGIGLDAVRVTTIEPHVDVALDDDWSVEAIAMGSLCLSGERFFAAEKLPERYVRPDGGFDYGNYARHWAVRTAGPAHDGDKNWPRTEVEVSAGDMILFAHHPVLTLHAVRQRSGQLSAARLLSWQAERPDFWRSRRRSDVSPSSPAS